MANWEIIASCGCNLSVVEQKVRIKSCKEHNEKWDLNYIREGGLI